MYEVQYISCIIGNKIRNPLLNTIFIGFIATLKNIIRSSLRNSESWHISSSIFQIQTLTFLKCNSRSWKIFQFAKNEVFYALRKSHFSIIRRWWNIFKGTIYFYSSYLTLCNDLYFSSDECRYSCFAIKIVLLAN